MRARVLARQQCAMHIIASVLYLSDASLRRAIKKAFHYIFFLLQAMIDLIKFYISVLES